MSLIPNLCMEIENSSFAGFNPVTIPGGALRDESFRGPPPREVSTDGLGSMETLLSDF